MLGDKTTPHLSAKSVRHLHEAVHYSPHVLQGHHFALLPSFLKHIRLVAG